MRLDEKLLVNLGSGEAGMGPLPAFFNGWRQVRLDIDPATNPDVIGSLTDLSAIPSDCADAVWASHCLEHIFQHEVNGALVEMRRVMKPTGLLCLRVPDLQKVAEVIVADRMHEVIYESPAGPVTAHDVVFGFGQEIALGSVHMAHKTGFTPSAMVQSLSQAGFDTFLVRRTLDLELISLARKQPWSDDEEPQRLAEALGF